jgi:F420-0:gamma-glutamyl ligase-like protein
MAFASLVIGAVLIIITYLSLFLLKIPVYIYIYMGIGVIGFVLGILAARRKARRWIAVTGMVLNLIAIFWPWVFVVLLSYG